MVSAPFVVEPCERVWLGLPKGKTAQFFAVFALVGALIVSARTFADTATAKSAPASHDAAMTASKPKPDPDEAIVCKTIAYTGSRVPGKRTCLPRRQWRQYELDSRDVLNDITRRADRANP